jgi:hypothetical protein
MIGEKKKRKRKPVSAIIIGGRNTESYPIPCFNNN